MCKPKVIRPLGATFCANEIIAITGKIAGCRRLNQISKAAHHATPTRIIGVGNSGKGALQALTIQRIIRNSAQLISNRSLVIR